MCVCIYIYMYICIYIIIKIFNSNCVLRVNKEVLYKWYTKYGFLTLLYMLHFRGCLLVHLEKVFCFMRVI